MSLSSRTGGRVQRMLDATINIEALCAFLHHVLRQALRDALRNLLRRVLDVLILDASPKESVGGGGR